MSQIAPQASATAAVPAALPKIFPCGQCNRKPFGSKAAVRAHRRDKHQSNQHAPPHTNVPAPPGPVSTPSAAARPPAAARRPASRNNPPRAPPSQQPISVLPFPGASSSDYISYGAPNSTKLPALHHATTQLPSKSQTRKKKWKLAMPTAPVLPGAAVTNAAAMLDFEYDSPPERLYGSGYGFGGNRKLNPNTGRMMDMDMGEDYGLCDKDCGWCGHCMEGVDI